ncbi:hypothetical protein Sjap_019928 [Stephania japonica]|uniref:Uncharacterized protein n=1 Tax=Stephania japonica TaxID=461633 RepID=A0AAP0I082_9MAGN
MEAEEPKSLLTTINPPRVEDAGLEDCALPPESIKEAFLKAANSVRSSWDAQQNEEDRKEGCVEDPHHLHQYKDAKPSDPGVPCGNQIGGGIPQVLGDEVAVGISGAQNEEDGAGGGDLLVVGGGGV